MTAITWLRSLIRKRSDLGLLVVLACFPVLIVTRRMNALRRNSPESVVLLWGAGGSLAYCSAFALCMLLSHLCHPPSNLLSAHPFSSPAYTITDLGTLPRGGGSYALAVNNEGQVVGTADTNTKDAEGDPIFHAFLWQNGALKDLGTLGACSRATGINEQGQIVGTSWVRPTECYAFLWQNGKMRSLGSLGGRQPSSWGAAINNKGQAVGGTTTERGDWYPFSWQNGKMRLLDPALSHGPGEAEAINSRGDIAGIVFKQQTMDAYVIREGRLHTITGLNGAANWPAALNDRGLVVGNSELDDEHIRAFVWQFGAKQAQDLGTLGGADSFASGLNERGDVVGDAETAGGEYRAALWHDGKIVDLNTLIPANEGWVLYYGSAINEYGQIVGVGKHNGKTRAFLMTQR